MNPQGSLVVVNRLQFMLFVNSKSGSRLGQEYLTVPNRHIRFDYLKKMEVEVILVDLFDELSLAGALAKLKSITTQSATKKKITDVKVIICGGDGTVLWVVSQISKYGIDTTDIVFGIIPLGTGNDFSRCLGWGSSPGPFSSQNISRLKGMIIEWMQCEVIEYDLWDVWFKTYQDGCIQQIKQKQQVLYPHKEVTRSFCNYFGIGIDARVSYSVEKHRRSNKYLNLLLYAVIGFCKLFQRINKIDQQIESFEECNEVKEDSVLEDKMTRTGRRLIIENRGEGEGEEKSDNPGIQINEGYCSLLCLNSTRYMTGLKDAWKTKKLGVRNYTKGFVQQQVDDGKIQFLAYKSQLRLGLQHLVYSGARIAQGEGPFVIKLRKNKIPYSTYVHIDGEAMKVTNLQEIRISKSQVVPFGKIKVLIKGE